ncbi:MAG: hypothetical protein M1497_05665 [Nitrospirae bacterium]|nr:hypothetical protein [Nitrospirota bacterium]
MTEKKGLEEIANQMGEHIMAVKGTLELMDASVSDEELHDLLVRAVERMDGIRKLSDEMLAVLRNCFDKLEAFKK